MKKHAHKQSWVHFFKMHQSMVGAIIVSMLILSISVLAYQSSNLNKSGSTGSSDEKSGGLIPIVDSTDSNTEGTTKQPSNPDPSTPQQQPSSNTKQSTGSTPQKSQAELANEKYFACREEETIYNKAYDEAVNRGWAARDSYKANIEAELRISNLPESEKGNVRMRAHYYAGQEANAIITPAYATYTSSLNSLQAKGCSVTQLYPDYTDRDLERYERYL